MIIHARSRWAQSPAAYFLQEQDITRDDAVNFIVHGMANGDGQKAA
jgi:hypothetical protein